MSYDDLSLDEDEALALLRDWMPEGFAGADVMAELAPEGWAQCELMRAFHPTKEQQLAEERAFQLEDEVEVPFPELSDIEAVSDEPQAMDPERECRDLVGRLFWEVLADDHSVIANDGRRIDLGDYDDASAVLNLFDLGEIDFEPGMEDWLDMWDRGHSTRFSADLAFVEGRADLSPVYELIFRRMQALDLDWIYQFPKLKLYSFEIPKKPEEGSDGYSPVEAFLSKLAHEEAMEECVQKQAKLDAINEASAQEAARETPPVIVQAYIKVFGRRPSGWPPA